MLMFALRSSQVFSVSVLFSWQRWSLSNFPSIYDCFSVSWLLMSASSKGKKRKMKEGGKEVSSPLITPGN